MLFALPEGECESAALTQVDHNAADLARLGRVNPVELFQPFARRSQLAGSNEFNRNTA